MIKSKKYVVFSLIIVMMSLFSVYVMASSFYTNWSIPNGSTEWNGK